MTPAAAEIIRYALALLIEAIQQQGGDELKAAVKDIESIVRAVRTDNVDTMDLEAARAELEVLGAVILAGAMAPDIAAGDRAADAEIDRLFPRDKKK